MGEQIGRGAAGGSDRQVGNPETPDEPGGSGAVAGKGEPSPVAAASAPATRSESESSASQAVGGLTRRFGREIEQPEDLNWSAVRLRA